MILITESSFIIQCDREFHTIWFLKNYEVSNVAGIQIENFNVIANVLSHVHLKDMKKQPES